MEFYSENQENGDIGKETNVIVQFLPENWDFWRKGNDNFVGEWGKTKFSEQWE